MKELSKNKSTLLYILLTGVLVVIAFISYSKISQFNKSVDWVIHSQVVKDNIVELRSIIKDAESGQRGYLITNDSIFLQPFIGAEQRSNLVFAKLDSLMSEHAGQQKDLNKLKALFAERFVFLNKKLELFKNKQFTYLLADSLLLESNNKMLEVRKQIALLLKTEDTFLEERIQVKNRSATVTPIFLLLLSLFSIVALTLFFFRLQKETNLRVSTRKLAEVEAAARKETEENLREISDYKYALDESSIVAITDQKGIIKYVNDNFCTISKYKRQELIGQDHRIISSGYHTKDFIRNIWTTIANGKLWKGEIKNKAKDGTIYWVDTTIVPFLDEVGKPYQYVAIRSDITAQKKSEEAIEKMATHLTLATDSANVGTWSLDIKTQKLEWSAVHKRMWGYEDDRIDLTYEDWHKLILPGDRENAFEKIEEAKVNHAVYEAQYYIKSANEGALRYMRSFGKYYFNDKGEAETLTGITIEITEQKEAEEKISQSEKRFRTLAETIPQLIWMTNEKGEYEYASRQWMEYAGLDPHFEETWQQLVHPDDIKGMMHAWKKSLATGNPYQTEARLKNKQGEYLWHIVRGIAIKSEEDKIVKWIGAFTDIHEQKIKEEKKDEFISIASHEMKTPLTSAKGYLELLLPILSETNQTAFLYANKTNQAVERLHSLVTELLDVSKIQHGSLVYNISTFNFNEMIEEAIENIQLTAKNHSLQKSGHSAVQIEGDKQRLQQVMTNLLSNAVKYSPNGEKVIITVQEQDGNLQVSVQDFGLGISSQHLDKIFDRYYRVQEHAVYFQGLGIGLHISSTIIQKHQGKMWAESEPGNGSTFYFTVPL